MERAISATEANQRFSEMLREVQEGDSFVVTSRGRPVARVVPVTDDLAAQADRIGDFLNKMKEQPVRVAGPWTREELYD